MWKETSKQEHTLSSKRGRAAFRDSIWQETYERALPMKKETYESALPMWEETYEKKRMGWLQLVGSFKF